MIDLKKIALNFDLELKGDDFGAVTTVTSLATQTKTGLSWVKNEKYLDLVKTGAVLMHESLFKENKSDVTFLLTKRDPKLVFSLILKEYFTLPIDYYLTNCVEEHKKNDQIKISSNVFIGNNVTIGAGTIIHPNVVIEANAIIGENCVLKSHTSIGTEGMGLELNPETGLLEKFPQLGKVILEDFVEVGPTTTIRRGALLSTVVRRGTKIGSLVNVGHNCEIGENCILTSGIVISGSSKIGNDTFIGVNTAIRNGINIGENVEIGMGAVVTKSIPDNVVVFGNPAQIKRER